jgi:hypothetical protein
LTAVVTQPGRRYDDDDDDDDDMLIKMTVVYVKVQWEAAMAVGFV